MELINGLGGASGFGEDFLGRNDDGSTAAIDLKAIFGDQGLSIGGKSYTSVYVNNNGNISFGAAFAGYTEVAAASATNLPPLIGILLSDVDTRGFTTAQDGPDAVTKTPGGKSTGSNLVWYDKITAGDGILTVTWDDVGYYNSHTDKLDAYQLRIIGNGGGNFTVEFRYETVTWAAPSAGAGIFLGAIAEFMHVPGTNDQDGLLSLDTMIGNTGEAGFWRWHSFSGTAAADMLAGSAEDDLIYGGTAADTLNGLAGSDFLDGGEGRDTMAGGVGNDVYVVSQADDVVIELADAGNDTIQTALGYSIRALANVENVQLVGAASVNAWGSSDDNILAGNSGNNLLVGYQGNDTLLGGGGRDALNGGIGNDFLDGGDGKDTMTGGAGNDVYVVSQADDVVTEGADGGNDTVQTALAYSIRELANVENVQLVGTASVNAWGSNDDNIVAGNSGNNLLVGYLGNDRLLGALGDDSLNGGVGNDRLEGGAGNDFLTGGVGADILIGGAGADRLVFNTLVGAGQVDTIFGFNSLAGAGLAKDKLLLDDDIFAQLGVTGAAGGTEIDPAIFQLGTAANDDGDRLIYDAGTGNLYYDADGLGGQSQVLFATLNGNPTLAAGDFLVVA